MAISVNAGEKEVKRANFGSKFEQWKAMHESAGRDIPTSRRPHVATSPRRDVPTSRRLNVATLGQPIQQSTSSNVATSQSRDVATSRRQREIFPPSLKAVRVQNWRGIESCTNEGTEFQSSNDTDFEEVPVICIVSHFLDTRMMFLRLNIYIFLFSMF